MKLETLTIKGLLRFDDPVSLDLRVLPAGLIAFTGRNGEGKTTMLESPIACLYRDLPTRKREVLHYATRQDGFIETTFEMEGRGVYKARLALDGPHKKAEGVLSVAQPDGSYAFLNDGKVTTYDAAIAKLLPPKSVLLASVFATQTKKGSFAELDGKGKKDLFTALLGLDHYEEMADRAKAAAGLVQQAIDRVTAARDVLARDADDAIEANLAQRSHQLHAEGSAIDVRRADLQRDLDAIHADLDSLQQAATTYATAQAQADRLEVEVDATAREFGACTLALGTHDADAHRQRRTVRETIAASLHALDTLRADTSVHDREVAAIRVQVQRTLADLDERIANNQKMLDNAVAIREAVAALGRLDAQLAGLRTQQHAASEAAASARSREHQLRNRLTVVVMAEAELQAVTVNASLLDTVPCGGVGEYAACQFLTNATEAKDRIPALTETVAPKAVLEGELAAVHQQVFDLEQRVREAASQITACESERRTHQELAARQSKLDVAETRIADLQRQKTVAEAEAVRQVDAAHVREQVRLDDVQSRRVVREREGLAQLADLDRRLAARVGELTATSTRLTARLADLSTERQRLDTVLALHAHASESAAAQRALLMLRQREWDASTSTLARLTSERQELDRRRQEFAVKRDELLALDVHLGTLKAEHVEWSVLMKALGRDGIPVVEIDAAGPTVSALTNDLLRTTDITARFTVDLITQQAKVTKGKDGSTMRDVFELRVFDSLRAGNERDLSDLSGGEQVLVDESLKSALAIYVNQRNVAPIRTCWRDETISALDPETAPSYMDILRRVHQLGGFHQTIFISHNLDAALKADAIVVFADGQVEVRLPPFVEPRNEVA